jgi:hypothetical protein
VAIDIGKVGSPGWWIQRLSDDLQAKQTRVHSLRNYLQGNPPLPEGAEGCREAYRKFQALSRTNFAELVVEVVAERMIPTGFRTGAEGDDIDDAAARRIWNANNLDIVAPDVHTDMLGLADGYVMVGPPDKQTGVPVITHEDPATIITAHDPRRPQKIISSLKVFRDDVTGRGFGYLNLPGQVWVATSDNVPDTEHVPQVDLASWNWDTDLTRPLPEGFEDVIPVVRFANRRGLGEFEPHTDILDRINYVTLQRLVIIAMQAYRQRATEGDLPEVDEDGNAINYAAIFQPGPGALWHLPEGVKLWESQITDVRPILDAAKDDIRDLAAVTRSPLPAFVPDGMNQTAEGAGTAKEGLIFKAGDRIRRASFGWNSVMSLAFRFAGDLERASILDLETLWRPPERLTLSERADAASKAQQDYPWRSRMSEIWGETPEAIARMEAERVADALQTAALAPTTAPSAPATAPAEVPDDADAA